MTEEQLKAFLAKVKAVTSLQEKLNSASDPDAAVELARSAGFVISADDLKKAQMEVSDEELKSAAGGRGKVHCRFQNEGGPTFVRK